MFADSKAKDPEVTFGEEFGTNLGCLLYRQNFPHDMRVTKNTLSIESWLFKRDPYNGSL